MASSRHSRPCFPAACLILLVFSICAAPAGAVESTPLQTANRSPFATIFGLPPAEPARLAAPGTTEVGVSAEAANMFISGTDAASGERLLLDGETYRWALSLRRRVGAAGEIGVEIPVYYHAGGFLDGFIDGWHDTFGLPSGDRDEIGRGNLTYRYDRLGKTVINFTQARGGLGDIRLTGAWRLAENERQALSLHASVKLPTGDPDRLTGSGSVDGSLSLAASASTETQAGTMTAFGSAGALGMTKGDVIADRQKNIVGFGTLGAGWSPWLPVSFTIQLNGHTGFYRSSLYQLGDPSLQLVVGGTVAVSSATRLDLGVVEDLAVATSPDVVFHLALRQSF